MGKFDFEKYVEPANGFYGGGDRKSFKDERFWKISKDANGKGVAIIRLLPDASMKTYVKAVSYSLKKPKPNFKDQFYWYIENSPLTIGKPDPVKEHYNRLMEEGTEEAKKEAINFRSKTDFICNIMVVKDLVNPENNGKVFLWKYGVKLCSKIEGWIKPSEQEIELGTAPMNLRHPLEGFNITLKIRPDQHSFTYDDTIVSNTPSSISPSIIDEDEAFDFITKNCYDLSEFVKPESFSSYEVLKEKFDKFLAYGSSTTTDNLTKKVSSLTQSAPKSVNAVEEDDDDQAPDWISGKGDKSAVKSKVNLEEDGDDSWMDALDD